jgi:hypothetical protein
MQEDEAGVPRQDGPFAAGPQQVLPPPRVRVSVAGARVCRSRKGQGWLRMPRMPRQWLASGSKGHSSERRWALTRDKKAVTLEGYMLDKY